MIAASRRGAVVLASAVALSSLVTACTDPSDEGLLGSQEADRSFAGTAPPALGSSDGQPTRSALAAPDHLGPYERVEPTFGTEVAVTIEDGFRLIEANGLPDHGIGPFPDRPDAQPEATTRRYQFPADPVVLNRAAPVTTPGVAINGVPFAAGTEAVVNCGSGERYDIEASQGLDGPILDVGNGRLDDDGTYRYHGPPILLLASLLAGDGAGEGVGEEGGEGPDLIHVGFAADGHLVYVSRTGAFRPGYHLATEPRTGSDCRSDDQPVLLEGTTPDGTYRSDWLFDPEVGDLDPCNGLTIDGEYLYVLTDTHPRTPRCLVGDVDDPDRGDRNDGGGGAGGGGGDGGAGGGGASGA